MHELQPGEPELIGPYRVRGRLGTGGMGRVYLGLSPGGRSVAVKVIRADLAQDAEFRARFRREVAVARKVSGLFTAPVIDADVDGPVPWLATAYVPGPSLADAVSEHGPLPAASVLALARGLAEGLSAIHAAGVVHRDLKPANVLLAEDGPRVIDFGISRAVEASALTHTGLVVGSPGFMSPEQAEGREVGPPSDIFSLGAVLAFAATGQGPFGSGSTPALVYRVVHSGPQLDLVPAEVRSLAERCLAKDPALRPTAADLLAAAAHPAAGWLPAPVTRAMEAAPTAGPGRPPRQTRRLGRWRPLTATLVLSALVGAGATAAVTMTADSAPAHASQSAPRATPAQTVAPASTPASSAPASPATTAPQTPAATTPAYVPPPSTPPATVTPPTSSAPPSPTTSPSPSTSPSTNSTPPTPAPGSSAPASQAGY
jgi:serine/threonine protein kinase